MSIYEKLSNIQQALIVPKNQRNDFGGYNFRSAEDILTALKPHLKEQKAVIFFTDNIIEKGNRIYVETTLKFIDIETAEIIETKAEAREDEEKKKYDGSQLTGSSSSYARKYALNGLFAIDDVKDSDFTNTGENNKTNEKSSKNPKRDGQIKFIKQHQKEYQTYITDCLNKVGKKTIEELDDKQIDFLKNNIAKKLGNRNKEGEAE